MSDINDIPGPGKFEGNKSLMVAEYLQEIAMNGFTDEQFGSVSENGIWEALIFIDVPNTIGAEKGRELFEKIKPAYIITEDNQGFFTYHEFKSQDDARARYFADLAAYESYYAK